jgi:hypothetical protein
LFIFLLSWSWKLCYKIATAMASSANKTDFIVWGADKTASGPVGLTALVSLVERNCVAADTWVFVVKNGVWRRAAELPELQMFFGPKPAGWVEERASNTPGP